MIPFKILQDADYTTGRELNYCYFEKFYKLIAIDLCIRQKVDADPKSIQQINFTGYLDRADDAAMFFIIEESKETILDFSEGTVRVL